MEVTKVAKETKQKKKKGRSIQQLIYDTFLSAN